MGKDGNDLGRMLRYMRRFDEQYSRERKKTTLKVRIFPEGRC